jgi:hypothetical protein
VESQSNPIESGTISSSVDPQGLGTDEVGWRNLPSQAGFRSLVRA